MTSYSLFHFGVSGLCALLAVLNLLLWLSVRSRRMLLLLALTFLGFTMLNAGIGGSSLAAAPAPLSTVPWIALALLSAFIPAVLVQVAPLAFDDAPGPAHRRLTAAMLVIAFLWFVVALRFVLTEATAQRTVVWEQVLDAPTTWMVWPFWMMMNTLALVWVGHAVRGLRVKPVAAAIVLLATIPAFVVVAREMAMLLGLTTGPSYFGLSGLPFFFFGTAVLGQSYVQAMRVNRDTEGLGRYRMIRRLGKGGMGELWLAARLGESGFTRYVAIKRILRAASSEEAVAQERFLAEARLAARLRHANIVGVYDLGKAEDGWFIVMEYLAGKSLAELNAALRGGLDVRVAASIAEQTARGLACAHRAGIIHRDVSPHNVMVTFEGVAKVVDFGVAKAGANEGPMLPGSPISSSEVTRAGLVIGKRPYLSPEQLDSQPSSPQSDQWALGVVLYESLVGKRPFDQETELAVFAAILQARFTPPRQLKPDLPEAVEAVVLKALSREPSLRFRDLDEFAGALARAVFDLPPVDLGGWMREAFSGAWAQERALSEGDEATPEARDVPAQPARPNADAQTQPHLASTATARPPKA